MKNNKDEEKQTGYSSEAILDMAKGLERAAAISRGELDPPDRYAIVGKTHLIARNCSRDRAWDALKKSQDQRGVEIRRLRDGVELVWDPEPGTGAWVEMDKWDWVIEPPEEF